MALGYNAGSQCEILWLVSSSRGSAIGKPALLEMLSLLIKKENIHEKSHAHRPCR
jgi:hypothetical protein